jgi:hypothetical protein
MDIHVLYVPSKLLKPNGFLWNCSSLCPYYVVPGYMFYAISDSLFFLCRLKNKPDDGIAVAIAACIYSWNWGVHEHILQTESCEPVVLFMQKMNIKKKSPVSVPIEGTES